MARKTPFIKLCEHCNASFETMRKNQKCCNAEHAALNRWKSDSAPVVMKPTVKKAQKVKIVESKKRSKAPSEKPHIAASTERSYMELFKKISLIKLKTMERFAYEQTLIKSLTEASAKKFFDDHPHIYEDVK